MAKLTLPPDTAAAFPTIVILGALVSAWEPSPGMQLRFELSRDDLFATALVTGLALMQEAGGLIAQLADQTRLHGDRRLLIDLYGLVGVLAPFEHEALGIALAGALGHLEKVASVVQADKITRISEQSAARAGLPLRVFPRRQDAVAWLLADCRAVAR